MNYVAEVSYYDGSLQTAYFGTRGFRTKGSDTPANTEIVPRIEGPILTRRDIFDIGTTGGASRVGFGELVLRNDDGTLDDWYTYGIDGRTLTIRVCDTLAAYPSGWTTLLTGTMEQAEVGLDTLRIRIRDRQVFATNVFQPNTYGGTNVLPAGLDGIETDLKGKPIPVVLGIVKNVEPVLVNTSKLIYQVHDGANWGGLRDVTAVYDSGALLTHGADYADATALEATAPARGAFRVYKAGGYIRLGSAPVGQVTCDAVQGLTPYARTAGALYRIVLEAAGIASGDISAADITALDTANDATLGLYVRDAADNSQVLDDIARSVGAWWGADADGDLRIQRLDVPSGSPVLALTGDDIVDGSLKRVPLNDNGLPVHKVTVRGVQNYTVQDQGLVGSVGSARRARLRQPFQDAIDEDAAVLTTHPLSPEMVVDTKLACLGECATEATRLQALYGTRRDRFELVMHGTAAQFGLIDLGVVISITYPRFGLDAGKLFRVLGFRLDPTSETASLTVWG